MVDIHTHILPGIDDGAQDRETSKNMLSALYAQGVNRVVFTPHYYGKQHSPQEFLQNRQQAYEKIKNIVPEGMEILLGAEVHFSNAVATNPDCAMLSIGETRYILIELPFSNEWTSGTLKKLHNFMEETDKIPVIAHFCRYVQFRKNPALLSSLVDMGCLLQANTSAFLDKKSSGLVFAAMRHNLVHCIATDCHNMSDRAPDYMQALQSIKRAGLTKKLEKIEENMQNIFLDRKVEKGCYTHIKKFFSWYK